MGSPEENGLSTECGSAEFQGEGLRPYCGHAAFELLKERCLTFSTLSR
jgi:hypothetical protein